MSKGSPIIPVRVPADLLAQVDEFIARTADKRPDGAFTRTSFILKCVADKLAHIYRSNRKHRKKEKACTSTSLTPPASPVKP